MDSTPELAANHNPIKFYIVSLRKFLILFIGTFGLYSVYWFYKQWSEYKKSTDEDMWPIMRAIFSIFFIHSLFNRFEARYEHKTGSAPRTIKHLATIYIVTAIVSQVCNKLADNQIGLPLTALLSIAIVPVSCWVLYQAQSLSNYSGDDVLGRSNDELTAANYCWLVLGAIFWGLILIGLGTLLFIPS